ncbi:hypothetical protein CRV10_03225 [Candidatus Pantoea edessiphila]|uniref:Rhodanese domain-containing protein n=1 Tax=Candidatus Pantoea edessiphila TaxID=2044610 RepID=A0A2P5SVJ4_9GAMM|nr:hypothetical protein CRV10_03225 [Candidatus Pantoea edessiphila]
MSLITKRIILKYKQRYILATNSIEFLHIIDIRSVDEQEKKPLKLNNAKVKSIPFYDLNRKFKTLDQNKIWFLYCETGIMSRLQALYLIEQGFNNVTTYNIHTSF